MFQTFTASSDASAVPDRLKRLRSLLADEGFQAVLQPRGDEHQGEYVAPGSERLKWLTGFSGSAGLVAVTRRRLSARPGGEARSRCAAPGRDARRPVPIAPKAPVA